MDRHVGDEHDSVATQNSAADRCRRRAWHFAAAFHQCPARDTDDEYATVAVGRKANVTDFVSGTALAAGAAMRLLAMQPAASAVPPTYARGL